MSTIHLKAQQDLVLYNLVIQGELKVAANNVTILYAKSLNNSYIVAEETTKDFKMILGGLIRIKKFTTEFISELNIIPVRTDNDNMQLVYEYTEKYPRPVYTVKLEHINQNFFDSMYNRENQFIQFKTLGGALCKWSYIYNYLSDNGIPFLLNHNYHNVFKIRGKLYDDKKGSLSLEGNKYILKVYNQARELDLKEIKFYNQQQLYHIEKNLSFEGMIPVCNASYYCYHNFSPNLSITTKNQVNYDSTHNILVFIGDNYKVLYHFNHQDIEPVYNINNVYYNITSNEICATCNYNQSLSSIILLKYQNNDTVPICFNSMLQNANITKYRDGLFINNCFLSYYMTIFHFIIFGYWNIKDNSCIQRTN
ncbi:MULTISPECIES: hypothetical protein [spotted fever group]|uniref:hypothetical protein n=1 Tax=spotted fever group TaxID=114277 RepID=UPI00058DF7C8|nr:hypothetical protein [Rickettsia endosymbiont of Ixodes scapularis]